MEQNAFLTFLLKQKNLPPEECQKIQHYLDLFEQHLTTQTELEVIPDSVGKITADVPKDQGDTTDSAKKALEEQTRIRPLRSNEFILNQLPSFKQSLKERYEWRGDIGKGGMGVVQNVYDQLLHREVAIKTLKTDTTIYTEANEIRRHRFYKEAEIMAYLEHPNIVPLYDIQETEQGQQCLIMRKIGGNTLSQHLQKYPPYSLHWNEIHTLSIISKICDAIAYAHSKSVIHRDLKPENIMLGAFGEVYVMDWGIAKNTSLSPEEEIVCLKKVPFKSKTSVHTIGGIGTPGYMPPEQKTKAAFVTRQSDIYALGKILRECYTGLSPQAEFRLVIDTIHQKESGLTKKRLPSDLFSLDSKIPKDIQVIIQKATEHNPEKRYPSIQEFWRDIERYLQQKRVSSLIKAEENVEQIPQEDSIQKQLKTICVEDYLIPRLLHYLKKQDVHAGEYLIRQGNLAEELYFVVSGLMAAQLELPQEKTVRLRSMGVGSIIGEIGLFLKGKRTVSVIAVQPSTVYCLSQEAFQKMKVEDMELTIVFQEYLIRVLGHRLNENSKVIETLLEEDSP